MAKQLNQPSMCTMFWHDQAVSVFISRLFPACMISVVETCVLIWISSRNCNWSDANLCLIALIRISENVFPYFQKSLATSLKLIWRYRSFLSSASQKHKRTTISAGHLSGLTDIVSLCFMMLVVSLWLYRPCIASLDECCRPRQWRGQKITLTPSLLA